MSETMMSLKELLGQVEHLVSDAMDYRTLLLRALSVMESAYGCPEWNTYARTEYTDETLELVRRALGVDGEDAVSTIHPVE